MVIKFEEPDANKLKCIICHKEFERFEKNSNHNGIRGKVKRPSFSITCSPRCSKINNINSSAKYRKDNAEELKEKKRQHYQNNLDEIRKYQREYRKNNVEKLRELHKKYREKNLDKIRKYKRKYRKENPEKVRESNRKFREKKELNKFERLDKIVAKKDPSYLTTKEFQFWQNFPIKSKKEAKILKNG